MSHVIEDIGDGFEDLGHGIENLGKEIGKTIEGVLKDPLPMVLSVAGSFAGIPPWVTMAAVTAARGGDLEDVAKSAAVSFATSAFMTGTQVGADIQSYTSNSWAGDFTDVMTDTFDLSPTASVAVAKAATSALNGAIVGGMRAAIMGDDVLKGMGSGFTSGGVYSSVDSFFDSVNKDQDWGLSTKTLNLAKGAASTGIMAMISGKGDPAAAVGNYIAYASMKMGTSELSKNAKEAYNEFRKNADIAQESGDNLKNVSNEYKAKQTEYEGKANEVESLITDYNSDLAKVAPVKAELDSIENEFNNATGQRVELVAQYNDIQSQHDSYDTRKSEFENPVRSFDSEGGGPTQGLQRQDRGDDTVYIDGRGAEYIIARDGDDTYMKRVDAVFNAPSKEDLLAQANAIKNQVNTIDAKQNELLTRYNSTAESIKPITDNLDAKAKVVEEKIAEVKSIEKDIATPQGDNLAAKLKAASDKYNQDYEKYTTSQNEANAKAQTFEMAKAEVAVRDATIDAVNNGVIQVTAKNPDGSYTLSNGMTLDSNGKFFQNGEQVYSTAVGVPQSKLNFTDNENNKVSFDENAGRRMSTSDVQNILKRDYGIEVDENTAKQYSGTAYGSENTALKEYAQTTVNEKNATQETERLKQAEITRVAEEKKAADLKYEEEQRQRQLQEEERQRQTQADEIRRQEEERQQQAQERQRLADEQEKQRQQAETTRLAEEQRVAEEKRVADEKEIAAAKAIVDKAAEGLTNPPTYGDKFAGNETGETKTDASSGGLPKEGDTDTKNGVNFVFKNGAWVEEEGGGVDIDIITGNSNKERYPDPSGQSTLIDWSKSSETPEQFIARLNKLSENPSYGIVRDSNGNFIVPYDGVYDSTGRFKIETKELPTKGVFGSGESENPPSYGTMKTAFGEGSGVFKSGDIPGGFSFIVKDNKTGDQTYTNASGYALIVKTDGSQVISDPNNNIVYLEPGSAISLEELKKPELTPAIQKQITDITSKPSADKAAADKLAAEKVIADKAREKDIADAEALKQTQIDIKTKAEEDKLKSLAEEKRQTDLAETARLAKQVEDQVKAEAAAKKAREEAIKQDEIIAEAERQRVLIEAEQKKKAEEEKVRQAEEEKVKQAEAEKVKKAEEEKAAQAKAVQDKAAQDKAAEEKAAQDKAAQDKAAQDKAAQDKAASDKSASDTAKSVTDLDSKLSKAIADARASGLEGDAALKKAIEDVAASQQTTAADILTKMGKSEADIRAQFGKDIAGVTGQVADLDAKLSKAIADAKASGLSGDAALKSAIEAVAASQQTTTAGILEKMGKSEADLKAQFGKDISALSTDVQGKFDALSDSQKGIVDAQVKQGKDLAQAIADVSKQTTGAIGDLSADVKSKFDTLTDAQKSIVDAQVKQGKDLTQAINDATTKTSTDIANVKSDVTTQITDTQTQFNARVDALMAQGKTFQEATNVAISELGTGISDIKKQQADAAKIAAEKLAADTKAAADKAAADKAASAATAAKVALTSGLAAATSYLSANPNAAGTAAPVAPQAPIEKIGLVTSGDTKEFDSPLAAFMKKVKEDSFATSPQSTQLQQGQNVQDNLDQQQNENQSDQSSGQSGYFGYGKVMGIDDILGPSSDSSNLTAKAGGLVPPLMASGGSTRYGKYAGGGLNVINHQGKNRVDFRSGDAVTGAGDGQSDDIPAMLADGEFVFPADVVAALGNGSTKAGSDKLYDMMHSIRAHHRSARPEDLPPPAKKSPLDYLKKHKARR